MSGHLLYFCKIRILEELSLKYVINNPCQQCQNNIKNGRKILNRFSAEQK